MADYTAVKIPEIESIFGGVFVRARGALGVQSFGLQVLEIPPGGAWAEHDHEAGGEEEVYLLLSGDGEIVLDGESVPLDTETIVRVGSATKRQLKAGDSGARVLAMGGTPGKAYEAPPYTEVGAPEPNFG
jgi:mannose-6-phosphate isomerase-like protein (cupin superfamily)